jgi:hypothetical protein
MSTRLFPLVMLLLAFGALTFSGSPSASAQEIAEVPGPLVLIGGRHQDLRNDIRDAFFDLAGGKRAKIVVTLGARPVEWATCAMEGASTK